MRSAADGHLEQKGSRVTKQYRHVDAALLRATAHTGNVIPQTWPDADGNADYDRWCDWLTHVWAQEPVVQAIAVASPTLADQIQRVCDGRRPSLHQVKRLAMSLARYLVRMRGRPTPFGMFAGVAAVRFGPQTVMHWSDLHQARYRADAEWLDAVTALLEACPTVLRRLMVTVNNLAIVRGERLVVPARPDVDAPGPATPVEVSVRHTQPVQVIVRLAQSPTRVDDLLDAVAAEDSKVAHSAAETAVTTLVRCGVLITNLRPPSTSMDGLAYLLHRLRGVNAATVPDAAPLVEELTAIQDQLLAIRTGTHEDGKRTRQATVARMRVLSTAVTQPITVDLRVGCEMVLPQTVAREAESAADALFRLAAHPVGVPGLREYHARFLDRYGPGAVVPVVELVDPASGLGLPNHYRYPQHPVATAELTPRDERLLTLAQQAALDDRREVVLDDNTIDALSDGDPDVLRPAPHIDLCLELRSPSTKALSEGSFLLSVTGFGATGIATIGRFLDILPDDDQKRMTALFGELPVSVDGALSAQLSFPANEPHAQNVLRAPQVLPHMISVAEHHDDRERCLALGDLAITADHNRMYVVTLSHRKAVEPVLAHAAARHAMPAVARLLFEIPRATNTAVSPFDWGAARCLPFRPRIRYGRTILTAARWRIRTDQLPDPTARHHEWTAALMVLRERLRLPDTVHIGTGDRRLRLNLDQPLDLALLRHHVDRSSSVITVAEAPTSGNHAWLDGRAHEIVIPLASTTLPAPSPTLLTHRAPLPIIHPDYGQLPGSSVLFAKIYGHPDVFDTILTDHLPTLLAAWDQPPPWWFVRYRTPAPHLRLRLQRLTDYGLAATRLGSWAADLRRRGLVSDLTLDTYRPEIARYGSGATMHAAEALFAADSTAAVAQLAALVQSRQTSGPGLIAASLVDLACAVTGSQNAAMRWLINHAELAERAPRLDRAVLHQALTLVGPGTDRDAPGELPGGPAIQSAWAARRDAAARYRTCLTAASGHRTPSSVLVSLLHMHYVRARGIDPEGEAQAHRLARAVALAWHARGHMPQGVAS
jgi:thiopeptide-type bacteriocin biosynthesis protein